MVDLANTVFRDFVTDGVPSSGANKTRKSDVRQWGAYLESLATLSYTNGKVYPTKAALDADLAPAANTPALVIGDGANDGLYMKVGATMAGSWTRLVDFVPGTQIVHAVDAGAGTPNAIIATSSISLSPSGSQLVRLDVFETNTGPVSVAFNGATPMPIKTASGSDPVPGGLVPGAVLGTISGGTFRLLSDQASAAIVAAAEVWANAADASATASDAAATRSQGYAALAGAALAPLTFATVASLLADTVLSYTAGGGHVVVGSGDIIQAQGFRYQVAASGASDHNLITAGGVKLYAIIPVAGLDPRQLGAPANGINDDAPFVEAAWLLSKHVKLGAGVSYLWKSVIGIPNQTLYALDHYVLSGQGATVVMDGVAAGAEFLTSASAKATPNSTSDLYTAKVQISGINWKQVSSSVIINGDRIYNVSFVGNNCAGITSVIKSFRSRLGNTNGYLQSVSLSDNDFANVTKIVDAKRCYNFRWVNNRAEACTAGVYVDGPDDAAVIGFSMMGGSFEGGGLSVKLGKSYGVGIRNMYFESNTLGDVATEKCEILVGDTTQASSGSVLVDGCSFGTTSDQRADVNYACIKTRSTGTNANIGALEVRNCWTSGVRLWGYAAVLVQSGNTIGAALTGGRQFSPAPTSPAAIRRTYNASLDQRLVSDNNVSGVFSIADIKVQDVLDYADRATGRRDASGTILVRMGMLTAVGGVEFGAALAVIDFVAMSSSNGVNDAQTPTDDCYIAFTLRSFVQIPASLAIEAAFGSSTKAFFTSPALTVSRTGNVYTLKLSGYANQTIPNYGAATVMCSSVSMEIDSVSPYSVRGVPASLIAPGGASAVN